MGIFGWSYPPGVSSLPYDEDWCCEVCLHDEYECKCPECPVCGTIGDSDCYTELKQDSACCLKMSEEQRTMRNTAEHSLREYERELDQYAKECNDLDEQYWKEVEQYLENERNKNE